MSSSGESALRQRSTAGRFGEVFTDHMVTMRWSERRGWCGPQLEPYGPLHLDPATAVFHYAQECFEGLKAYRRRNGSVALFRPEQNAARFNQSARRLAMPEVAPATFISAVETLVRKDRDWVPDQPGHSLYLRPFMIATQASLGCFSHPADSYLFCVIASPVSAYFGCDDGAPRAVSVWLSEQFSRAAPGGMGAVKAGANYAGGFVAHQAAVEHGCDQVVWLDAVNRCWVEEMGGMNLFFVYAPDQSGRQRVTTSALTGTLLPGITRDSLLRLAPRLKLCPGEERLSIQEWSRRCETGEMVEAFACGTAAVVTPIGEVRGENQKWTVGDGTAGRATLRLRNALLGIQYGHRPDRFGWMRTVC